MAVGIALLLPSGSIRASEHALAHDSRAALVRAFAKRYDCDARQTLTLVLRQHGREFQRQRISVVTKLVDRRLRALGRFTDPPDLRDTAILMLEGEGNEDQLFMFLPVLGRVRRVSGAQRGDSFMGTDLTYEDLQRPRVDDFGDFAGRPETLDGETTLVVTARSLRPTYYERTETWVARTDDAILRVVFFKSGSSEPFKIIETPRGALLSERGNIIPRRILVTNLRARTETEIFVDELELNAKTDDSVFTTTTLVVERDVPKPGSARGDVPTPRSHR